MSGSEAVSVACAGVEATDACTGADVVGVGAACASAAASTGVSTGTDVAGISVGACAGAGSEVAPEPDPEPDWAIKSSKLN